MRRVFMLAFGVILIVLLTFGPARTPTTSAQQPAAAKIVIAIGSDPSTLDPQYPDDGNMRTVNDNVYEVLIGRDPKTEALVPILAESYAQKDATTWEVKLRQGVKFQNGEAFDADAAASSIKRIIDPSYKSELLSFVSTIKDAKVVDPATIQIITTGPDPILPARLTWLAMVPPKYSAEKDFPNKPVGTGPYKFVEWVKGDHVTLQANPDYWGTKPSIQNVVIRMIPEAATRVAALRANEVDLIRDLPPESTSLAPKVAAAPGLEFPWIRINTKKGKLADVRVRQALNYAVDKEALAKSLYGGYAVVADGQILTPGHFGYSKDVKAYPFDAAKAKALLSEAGASGLELQLVGESGRWLKDKELVEAVAGYLQAVGLKPKVQIAEWSAWLDLLFAGPDKAPDLLYSSNDNSLLDADRTLTALFHTKTDIAGGQSAYSNPALDKLIDDARTETDTAKRAAMYDQANKIVHDDAPCIFLLNLQNIYGLSKRLNWTPRLDGRIFVNEMTIAQ
jgi:peptide/nickel transport system substrate-binding protein